MGSVANALWTELNRVKEHQISAVESPAPTARPRAPGRTVGAGVLVAAVLALGAWATWSRSTAPAPVSSVIQTVPTALPVSAMPSRVLEPTAAGQSPGVVVVPQVPPVPRTELIPPKGPVVKRASERAGGTRGVEVTAPAISTRDIAPAPEGAARPEPRAEPDAPDPSAIIDWLLKESPRRQR